MKLVRYYPTSRPARNERTTSQDWAPATDVRETEHGYTLEIDLPGVEKSDFNVTVDGGVLEVTGERKREEASGDGTFYRYYERPRGSFRRSFRIPENVSVDNVNASYVGGVLKLELTKKEEAKPRTVKIS